MSILYTSNIGWFISHEDLINSIYSKVTNGESVKYKIVSDIFEIKYPFKKLQKHNLKRKSKEESTNFKSFEQLEQTVQHVQKLYRELLAEVQHLLRHVHLQELQLNKNDRAIELSKKIYDESHGVVLTNSIGENKDEAKYIAINGNNFLFPSNCKFYCKDVVEIERHLTDIQYDLIVLDPPWWNKYVRRKRAKTNHGYEMMYNDTLKEIPIERLLNDDGLIVVWCTNSLQHLEALTNTIFPKWKVNCIAKWYWLKITQSGEPVCSFSKPPGKQPFEHIILGCRNSQRQNKPIDGKLIASIPSALHSHKPPLTEILSKFLPENPTCLELFARYLLPNWTSWGLEVIRFQHESLYESIFEETIS